MKVKCINNRGAGTALTMGKTYEILTSYDSDSHYLVTDDRGIQGIYFASRFIKLKEKPAGYESFIMKYEGDLTEYLFVGTSGLYFNADFGLVTRFTDIKLAKQTYEVLKKLFEGGELYLVEYTTERD